MEHYETLKYASYLWAGEWEPEPVQCEIVHHLHISRKIARSLKDPLREGQHAWGRTSHLALGTYTQGSDVLDSDDPS